MSNKNYKHARRRARQRYGLPMNQEIYKELISRIQEQNGIFLQTESKTISHWAVEFEGDILYCVYDKKLKRIKTFLPQNCLEDPLKRNATIIRKIQSKKAHFLERMSNRRTRWLVKYQEKIFYCIHDKRYKTLISCKVITGQVIDILAMYGQVSFPLQEAETD